MLRLRSAARADRACAIGLAALMMTTALTAIVSATPAYAQAPAEAAQRSFDIPAQPLTEALIQFGRQAGLQASADAALIQNLRSAAVRGTMTWQQALNAMLSGTGLTYRLNGSMVALEKLPQVGDGTIQLAPVTVEGQAGPPRQAEIGSLPPEYAGGQVARGGKLGILGNKDFMDAPFSQTNYTSKLIQDQQAIDATEVLANDPAVQWLALPSEGYTNLAIRGFRFSGNEVLFDGLPGLSANSGQGSVMAQQVERVEVLRGPSAMMNGAINSVGGAINFVPKRAGDQPLTEFTGSYISESHFGGHVDVSRRYGVDERIGVRINGAYNTGDLPIDHSSVKSKLATLALDYRGDSFRLSGDFGFQEQKRQGARRRLYLANGLTAVPKPPDNRTNPNAPYEFTNTQDIYGLLQGEVDIIPAVTAFAKVGTLKSERENIITNLTITDLQGTATGRPGINHEIVNQWTAQGGLRGNIETGPIDHQITAAYTTSGQTSYGEFGDTPLTPITVNIYNPVFGPNQQGISGSTKKQSQSDISSLSLVDTLSILNERVQLSLGVSRQQIDVTNFDKGTGSVTSKYDEYAYTPLVGLVVKPWENISIYGNYAEALQRGSTAPNTAVNAGEIFPPFVSKGYEAGVKIDWGKLAATFAAFQISQPSAFTDPATNIFSESGEQRHRGVEFSVFGEVTDGVRLQGGLAYIDAVLVETAGGVNNGNKAPVAPFQARLGAEWDIPFLKGLTLTGLGSYASSKFINNANTLKIPDSFQLDAGLRYTIERGDAQPIIIRATVTNILDTNDWVGSIYDGGNGTVLVREPRAFRLSTTFRF